jgi:signal transduction histidine kinase
LLRSINSKFYAIAFLLVLSFGIGYGILAYFLHQLNKSTAIAREVVSVERGFSKLHTLFHETRFWESVIIAQKNPEAERQFGARIAQVQQLLVDLNQKELNPATKSTLKQIKASIKQYEDHFNGLIQLKIKQSLLRTRMETHYRSMVSIILSSDNPSLLKPLFNLTHFLTSYRVNRDVAQYQALRLVINSIETRVKALALADVRMRDYLHSFRDLLDEDFTIENDIIAINKAVESINLQLNDYFTQTFLELETYQNSKFQESTRIRQELGLIFQMAALVGVIFLFAIILLISRNIIKPIKAMALVMQEVKAGDISTRFKNPNNKEDEIIQLGISFNAMLDTVETNNQKLIDNRNELEQKIIELSERELEGRRLAAQLQRAQKMEAIGTLAGGVAHDLNNVLSGIASYPELLLLDMPEDSPYRNTVLAIQESGLKAAAIVQDLLTLARRGVAVTEITNLNDLVDNYLSSPEYKNLASLNPEIEIKIELAEDLLNIQGSPVHLLKTIMNLVSNAVESIRAWGTIIIRTANQYVDRPIKGYDDVEEGDFAVLSVEDTGSGIPTADQERIFEPFFTKKIMGHSGTGLGMTVVWGTVKDHKGYIDVQSAEGQGSKFNLYFPATRQTMVPEASCASIENLAGNGETVLVVDDVPRQRQIASEMLQRLGYIVETAASGEETLNYFQKHTADLIVLDMIMEPGIDGLETYKRVLRIAPHQKAIITSGYSETNLVRETQRLGAGEYIKKPYTLREIGRAIQHELAK